MSADLVVIRDGIEANLHQDGCSLHFIGKQLRQDYCGRGSIEGKKTCWVQAIAA